MNLKCVNLETRPVIIYYIYFFSIFTFGKFIHQFHLTFKKNVKKIEKA